MKHIVTLLIVTLLCGCGSTIDPTASSAAYPVRSSGSKSVALYAAKGSLVYLKMRGEFLPGGHIEVSETGNVTEDYQYIGVLGQTSSGRYMITTPSNLVRFNPTIEFFNNLQEVRFAWTNRAGKRHDVKLYRL